MEDDPLLRRRRTIKDRRRKRLALATIIICAVVLLAVVTIAISSVRRAGPSESAGEEWTAVELRDNLRSKGLKVWMGHYSPVSPTTGHRRAGSEALVFGRDAADSANLIEDISNQRTGTQLIVCFQKWDTPRKAKEFAGFFPETHFAWGCYTFWSEGNSFDDKPNLEKLSDVHKALTGRPFNPRP